MTKLPEPAFTPDYGLPPVNYYTSEQMLEMRRDALYEAIRIAREREVERNDAQFRRDALEDAALVCDALAQKASSSIAKSAFNVSANEIRTLKEQIK
jgi:hypothetical protein